jgi:hypothetical protein
MGVTLSLQNGLTIPPQSPSERPIAAMVSRDNGVTSGCNSVSIINALTSTKSGPLDPAFVVSVRAPHGPITSAKSPCTASTSSAGLPRTRQAQRGGKRCAWAKSFHHHGISSANPSLLSTGGGSSREATGSIGTPSSFLSVISAAGRSFAASGGEAAVTIPAASSAS